MAIDINSNHSIEANFWDSSLLLLEDYVYQFNNVMIENNKGLSISKMWCSTFVKEKKCTNLNYELKTALDLTNTTVKGEIFEKWSAIFDSTTNIATINGNFDFLILLY